MSEGLREVNVNGVRYFQADDVERWHRGNVAKAEEWDELSEQVEHLREFVEHTLNEYGDRMPSQWKAHARAQLAGRAELSTL